MVELHGAATVEIVRSTENIIYLDLQVLTVVASYSRGSIFDRI